MSRNREPALYELISQKQSLLKPAERSDAHDDIDLEHNVITPGRSVRMPLGTIAVRVRQFRCAVPLAVALDP